MSRGTYTAGDLFKKTVDGVSTAEIYDEFTQAITLRNKATDDLRSMFTYSTTAVGDEILQAAGTDDFEMESEHGIPKSIRVPTQTLLLGFDLRFYDAASRFTHIFLRDADSAQVASQAQAILDADNRLVHTKTMRRVFNPEVWQNPEGLSIFGFYSGDGGVPPTHNEKTFSGSHTHYLTSGAAVVDGGDLRDVARLVTEHGYGDPSVGGRVVVFANPNETELIRGFKKGAAATDPYDWIPAAGTDAYLSSEQIIGDVAPAQYGRVKIAGSYGPVWVSENALIPVGYLAALASYGPGSSLNPLAFREHLRSELRGLRQIPGPNGDYPLQESYASRGFGVGVARRGAGAVMQITANATYTVPAVYA